MNMQKIRKRYNQGSPILCEPLAYINYLEILIVFVTVSLNFPFPTIIIFILRISRGKRWTAGTARNFRVHSVRSAILILSIIGRFENVRCVFSEKIFMQKALSAALS